MTSILYQLKERKTLSKESKRPAAHVGFLSMHLLMLFTKNMLVLSTICVAFRSKTNFPVDQWRLKKMDSVEFLGLLYNMKFMLPSLTALSKTFQTGAINFSRIKPNLEKTKAQLQNTATQQTALKKLKSDVNG